MADSVTLSSSRLHGIGVLTVRSLRVGRVEMEGGATGQSCYNGELDDRVDSQQRAPWCSVAEGVEVQADGVAGTEHWLGRYDWTMSCPECQIHSR